MDLHFIDTNGNHFVVPDAPENYVHDGATLISSPPSMDHRWIDGEWKVPPSPEPSTDPADYPLLPWQFKVMVDVLDVDAAIRAAIEDIEDVWQRAVAMRRYTDATSYEWSDPLLQQIRAAIGMSEEDLASHWMVAKDLRST